MNRIENAFKGGSAFIGFLTGGDPDLDTTKKLICGMEEAGADLIEIGIPFSDPIAEGPVIQAADIRALSWGCTIDDLFRMVKEVREQVKIPLVFMTYINPVYTYGKEKFMRNCKESGIDGIIVPDLPFEEKNELLPECNEYGVKLISLIAPTSKERVLTIAKEAEGFLYCVSSLGVTGVRSEIKSGIEKLISQVKTVSDIPCAIGFGISKPKQAAKMASVSDGVIVGSAIVKIIAEYGRDSLEPVKEYVSSMKAAVQSAGAENI